MVVRYRHTYLAASYHTLLGRFRSFVGLFVIISFLYVGYSPSLLCTGWILCIPRAQVSYTFWKGFNCVCSFLSHVCIPQNSNKLQCTCDIAFSWCCIKKKNVVCNFCHLSFVMN
jgi:hypothetical protein